MSMCAAVEAGEEQAEGAKSFDEDLLIFNVLFYLAPVNEVSCRLIFRSEGYRKRNTTLKANMLKSIVSLSSTRKWILHALTQSTIIDGDMVLLNRQSMQLMYGDITSKEYFMPAASDVCTREPSRHFNTYSKKSIKICPHTVVSDVLPPEQPAG